MQGLARGPEQAPALLQAGGQLPEEQLCTEAEKTRWPPEVLYKLKYLVILCFYEKSCTQEY